MMNFNGPFRCVLAAICAVLSLLGSATAGAANERVMLQTSKGAIELELRRCFGRSDGIVRP